MNNNDLISFDYAIKYLLKDKGDYEIIEGFISALLKSQGYGAVKIKALLESESNKEEQSAKRSIADVVVEDEEGHKYIVEIDKAYTKFFLYKACFNTSRLIVDSISKGEDYSTIKKVFHINLIYFPFSDMKTPLYHGKTIIREVETHGVEVHLAEGGKVFDNYNLFPEYFIISVPLFDDTIKNEMDEWLYLMKNSTVQSNFKSPYMKKVADRLSIMKMTPAERKIYNSYVNESLKERDRLISAEEKGEAKGEAKIVKMLLKNGNSIEKISEMTGMSKEEIESLAKSE